MSTEHNPRATGERGLALIKESEGLRLSTYLDAVGKPTIGYGHLIRPGETFNGPISQQQAEALLRKDLADTEQGIAKAVRVSITQGQFDALASFVFNLGRGGFALQRCCASSTRATTPARPISSCCGTRPAASRSKD